MHLPEPLFLYSNHRLAGPLVLGVPPAVPRPLLEAAADLAAALDVHLVCAYVDPASYLTEWENPRYLLAASLDPETNLEAVYPAGEVRRRIENVLGPAGSVWTFRVLNGDISSALSRLAESTGASMFVVGGGRDGILPRISRALEGSIDAALIRIQNRPVIVIPEHVGRRRPTTNRRRVSD